MAETIYRKDYQAPSHWVDTVRLEFDLDPESTSVTSTLSVRPNLDLDTPQFDWVLNGESLTLVSVALNGTPLPETAYTLTDETLTLHNIVEPCEVTIVNRFSPQANTALQGIYVSGENLMSQCESQGFRRITYYPDRPDVLARFKVVIRAEKRRYPVLLSNGNPSDARDLDDGRHEVVWTDPFPKPSYLFALVAGNLVCQRELFELKDGRNATLEVWVEPRDLDKTAHTMESLKKSIRWDEERFGLELDLDGFRIVATQDFNFGAMENKGLNIFNARYALANPKVATDQDYANIESVVGHEYFHNWTGNRITLRDWFQLTLKEGLTVFRDQEFSSDMLGEESARAVERIKNVIALRQSQFREDASPMAHPIRPESYQKIDNFYTATVYEKGAEVIRLLQTLLGWETFRKGFDDYIQTNDGNAVTCEAFLEAMERASGRDLKQFKRWYSQAGTPRVTVMTDFDPKTGNYTLQVSQSTPATPGQSVKKPFLIPFPVSFMSETGDPLPVRLVGETTTSTDKRLFELTEERQTFVFTGFDHEPVLSLNHGFAAPIQLEIALNDTEGGMTAEQKTDKHRALQARFERDAFVRWDALNQLMLQSLRELIIHDIPGHHAEPISRTLMDAFDGVINDATISPAYKALLMTLPSETLIGDSLTLIDPQAVAHARQRVRTELGSRYSTSLNELVEANLTRGDYTPDAESAGRRSLVRVGLDYLMAATDKHGQLLACELAENATNLTDRLTGLTMVNQTRLQRKNDLLLKSLREWMSEPLLLNKWLAIIAGGPSMVGEDPVVDRVRELVNCAFVSLKNPNNVYALVLTFFMNNPAEFHRLDGQGYALWLELLEKTDKLNPHVAARIARTLENWRRYTPALADQMYMVLNDVLTRRDEFSPGVIEIVDKALNNPL